MIKKTVTYVDFEGQEVTEDLYFHLTASDVMELEVSEREGFFESMQRIVKAESGAEIIAGFKKIVLLSFGRKDPQGRFYKNQHETEVFASSPAYSEVFMELATDAEAGSSFVNQIVPPDFEKQVARLVASSEKNKAEAEAAKTEQAQVQAAMDAYVPPTVSVPTVTPDSPTPQEMSDYEAWRAQQAQKAAENE